MPPLKIPQRQNTVRPNSQNLMEGPSYWTNEQRRLNVPNADANPVQRENNPFDRPVPAPVPGKPVP
ncbi:hypothetical protein MKI84_08980 [Ancylobacter sp. A5.8]|uniref:hypothetical protein n=1 Tax=Ancylobacter gelatini TaxID=2919920 RepID=UPI001F4E2CBB|nr:hypothetical protein [Ancylobacter gelatini]MCJ8143050.1 hypothetical protein [Ancylobacter gelatini]